MDMSRLFEKGRRCHELGSEQYGHVLILQRLYQAITSPNPPPGPPYMSATHFASVPAGPGTAKPLHATPHQTGNGAKDERDEGTLAFASSAGTSAAANAAANAAASSSTSVGVTTFRVSNKDRQWADEVDYKGWSVRLADWLHLANPDDPSRPIVVQVFKCWISEEP